MHYLKDGSIKPTAHAPRTLFPSEKNNSEIEKKRLGILCLSLRNFIDSSTEEGLLYKRITDHC